MFRTDTPRTDLAIFTPIDADLLLDDEFFDPAQDDYLDRCLFEFRQSAADFRNL